MGYIELAGEENAWICKKLVEAFDPFTSVRLVRESVPEIVNNINWGHPGGWSAIAFDVVLAANRHGRLDRLLATAAVQRPWRDDLRALVLRFSAREGWSVSPEGHDTALGRDGLQQLTSQGNPFTDTAKLAHWLIRTERQVCQVRCGGSGGSGFLVGQNLVLTCYHVVEDYLHEKVTSTKLQVRFDYRSDPLGKVPPYDSLPWLDIDPSWKIPYARHSKADETLEGEPATDELDYALLKLASSPGSEALSEENTARGWVDMSRDWPVPPAEAPILIVQYPELEGDPPHQQPLKIAFATPGFDGLNANGTRIRYKPSTKKGSSGSPVFGPDLHAVALHHNRGQINPAVKGLVLSNRGIPLAAIRAAMPQEVRDMLVAPPP
ncbi:MAG: trypsin-like peptidase domain-containing protein [Myxococcales bacterium]|nr:trypsin-like peptidase domain-containing protein [Myxococcales bacterium]